MQNHSIATTAQLWSLKWLISKTPLLLMWWCIYWLHNGFRRRTGERVGVLITSMALVHPLHPIKIRSRNKRWEPVGWMTCLLLTTLLLASVHHLCYPVETLYNTINFCWSTHKRHSIARPKGRGMGCLLWVQRATYCVDLSLLSSMKYLL